MKFENVKFHNSLFCSCKFEYVDFCNCETETLKMTNAELKEVKFVNSSPPWNCGDYVLYWLKERNQSVKFLKDAEVLKGRNGDMFLPGLCRMSSKYRDSLIELAKKEPYPQIGYIKRIKK